MPKSAGTARRDGCQRGVSRNITPKPYLRPPQVPNGCLITTRMVDAGAVAADPGVPGKRTAAWVAAVAVPLLAFVLLLVRPSADRIWESHPAHFWTVLGAAAASVAVGWTVSSAGRRRRDARLFLVSLACLSSAGFLALHALATPGVLLGKNAGFELATPVGLVIASAFAALSAVEFGARGAGRVLRAAPLLLGGLAAALAAWAMVSLAALPPLDSPIAQEQLDGWQLALAGVGLAFYAVAAAGYLRLYRRRGARFVIAVTVAFALLAEAMIVIAWARNWHASWWEWHLLMLASFLLVAESARTEWHEERFSAIYLDETLAGARDVSVLLADLSGFTSFSERHEPDRVAAMLNAYFGAIVPLMERERGEVHQIVGDELMVIFNKQGDTPDHPLRAARAALTLLRTAETVARPDWPRFRVGVNSGDALAAVVGGATGHRKHGIVGDTVNVAARLEQAAEPATVILGAATYERLPIETRADRLPPLDAKGKAEPVEAYRLHSLGTTNAMTETDETPREDDRNEEIDESPAPDPEEGGDAEDDPGAD
jgi:adenylate cyclase